MTRIIWTANGTVRGREIRLSGPGTILSNAKIAFSTKNKESVRLKRNIFFQSGIIVLRKYLYLPSTRVGDVIRFLFEFGKFNFQNGLF